jgi:hypothetical protein
MCLLQVTTDGQGHNNFHDKQEIAPSWLGHFLEAHGRMDPSLTAMQNRKRLVCRGSGLLQVLGDWGAIL